MALEVVGAVMVASHIFAVTAILFWLGTGKPTSMAQFRARLKKECRGLIPFRGRKLEP